MPVDASPPTPRVRWPSVGLRLLVFAVLWGVLTGGSLYGIPLAALSVAAATAVSLTLVPPGAWPIRPAYLLRLGPFFLWESFRGGIDVAWRALHPSLPIRPGYVAFPLRLQGTAARTLFAACLSLMPGTVCTEMTEGEVRVHVLDSEQEAAEVLRRLERHVGALFGEELGEP